MSNLPDKISAVENAEGKVDVWLTFDPMRPATEYLRFDLHLAEIAERDKRINDLIERGLDIEHDLAQTQQRLAKAEGVIAFYADERNWANGDVKDERGDIIGYRTSFIKDDAGQRARDFLKGDER